MSWPGGIVRLLRQRRVWLRAVVYFGIYLAYACIVTIFQRDIIYPRPETSGVPSREVKGIEQWALPIGEGTVQAFFLPPTNGQVRAPLVVFAHGNAEVARVWLGFLDELRQQGFAVLVPEFRGYDRSAGSPSEDAIVEDFGHFIDRALLRPDVDPRGVYYIGRSLGGGVVCALAARRPPKALVLLSAFTSLRPMAHRLLLPGFLVFDPYDNMDVVRQLSIPVYVAHGRHDDLVPFKQGEAVAHAARHGELHPLDCAHEDCPPDMTGFFDDVGTFLARVYRESGGTLSGLVPRPEYQRGGLPGQLPH